MISEKEITILTCLDVQEYSTSQRMLAQKTGISVGLVNAILKKLVRTGYVKVVSLNKKQVQYLLTPIGFLEKAKRSCSYVLKIAREYQRIQSSVKETLDLLDKEGYRSIILHGDGELRGLVEAIVREELSQFHMILSDAMNGQEKTAVLNLGCDPVSYPGKVIPFIDQLNKTISESDKDVNKERGSYGECTQPAQ